MFRIVVLALFVAPLLIGCGSSEAETSQSTDEQKPKAKKKKGIIGKMTQDIAKFDPAAGRKVSDNKINATNPLTAGLDAYGPMHAKVSQLGIQKQVQTFYALKGKYPTYEEFMEEIIKKYNLRLPVLPYKMEYQYDEENHKLVVVHPLEEPTDEKESE